ncbi:hypothetical protein NDU88_001005 [Pleurodeles waltl]|uniref:Secreted protein n=1 Tax=Pleurodeles waltl TaxID=8319 RepID=A0AAV7LBT5_PLEWA|nr:hypothetical protein NDU88_001005 [Pleurodeles waltl]
MRVSARVGPRPEGAPSFFFLFFILLSTGPRDCLELRFPAATGSARLPVVVLGPKPSGLGPTRALTRIHAGAPAQLGRPP